MIEKVLDRASVAFAGAVLAFLLAKYGYGATGLDEPQNLAYGGLILTAAAHWMVRDFASQPPRQDSRDA